MFNITLVKRVTTAERQHVQYDQHCFHEAGLHIFFPLHFFLCSKEFPGTVSARLTAIR